MLFTLEPLPAAEGDCLLLHWGTAADPKIAVIDGGPGQIYETHLRPRLEEIVAKRGLARLPLELVMVSHMDSDHIVGVKKLARALRREVEDNIPAADRRFEMKRLWHNVFNDVLGDSIDKYYQTLTASVQASVGGQPNPALAAALTTAFQTRQGEPLDEAAHNAWDLTLVLAGHGEGRDLRRDHKYLFGQGQTATLNHPFKTTAGKPTLITAELTPAPIQIAGLEFKVVGPRKAEIEALQKEFDQYIKKAKLSVQAVLAAYADKSIKNLSSIVCLAKFGGKSILFTGDARGDKILAGLETAGMVAAGGKLAVDILKVPHHGSDRNVTKDFFKRITADTYVFSGDGKHGNPDRETFQWLAEARGKEAKYRVILTYDVDDIDATRKRDFAENDQPWSEAADSLKPLFKRLKTEGYKFTVEAGAPIKLHLGDEKPTW